MATTVHWQPERFLKAPSLQEDPYQGSDEAHACARSQMTGDPRNRTRIEFTPINREYIYQLKEDLNLSLSKVVNMLITATRTKAVAQRSKLL